MDAGVMFDMKIILSMTSTFERSDILYYTIQSILNQSFKPDLMLLNLSKAAYLDDSGFHFVPDWLDKLDLTINFVQNTGPYRKLLPALSHAGNDDIIVTADDDILYDKNWLKALVDAAKSEPDSIVCCRARTIQKNIFNKWQNYSNWQLIENRCKNFFLLPTCGAGAVYRKKLLDINFLTNQEFLNIAPTTDDLWFRMAGMLMNTPVAVFPEIDKLNVYLKHKHGLEKMNNQKNKFSFVPRIYYKKRLKIANYIGMNQTKNDFSWDAICDFSQLFIQENRL
jgi:glycosyltransferase involved in cell wall biosynthesis